MTDDSSLASSAVSAGTPGPGTGPASVLQVSAVSKHFAGVQALQGVSFDLRPAEVHALIGENGAGKSTLIKVITGVYQADSGEISYQGEPVDFGSPLQAQEAGISTIYQEVNLVPLMSVARNLFLGREPRNFGIIDSARMKREARQILAEYGVQVNVSRPLRTLGLGAQQMVAIARAVQIKARVVIMDEPTSSLGGIIRTCGWAGRTYLPVGPDKSTSKTGAGRRWLGRYVRCSR